VVLRGWVRFPIDHRTKSENIPSQEQQDYFDDLTEQIQNERSQQHKMKEKTISEL
jgi:transposase